MVLIRVGCSFTGIIYIGDKNYCYQIVEDEDGFNKLSVLKLDWRLKKVLGSSLKSFLLRNEFSDVDEFHNKFTQLVKSIIPVETQWEEWLKTPLQACSLVKTLQQDIKNVGENIRSIDFENKTVDVEINDAQFRTHKAVLKLSNEYPKGFLTILQKDLPSVKTIFNENIFDMSKLCTISDFIKKFVNIVNTLQEFWNILASVDLQCLVLDPPNPTFKDNFRRIKIHDMLSVGLTLDPLKPRQIPSIKLFGHQKEVETYRQKLQKNLEKEMWDCNKDLIYNISNILDITLPNKMFSENTEFSESVEENECAICFMTRLNEELPNEMCEMQTCKLKYHSVCLYKYISSFPKNKEYFGKIQGECPSCDNVISCSVPNILNCIQ